MPKGVTVTHRNIIRLIDNTNFIDMVDNSFWNKNQKDLTKILFDLHPTPYGYKKLAQDVFVRLISHIVNKEALQNLG